MQLKLSKELTEARREIAQLRAEQQQMNSLSKLGAFHDALISRVAQVGQRAGSETPLPPQLLYAIPMHTSLCTPLLFMPPPHHKHDHTNIRSSPLTQLPLHITFTSCPMCHRHHTPDTTSPHRHTMTPTHQLTPHHHTTHHTTTPPRHHTLHTHNAHSHSVLRKFRATRNKTHAPLHVKRNSPPVGHPSPGYLFTDVQRGGLDRSCGLCAGDCSQRIVSSSQGQLLAHKQGCLPHPVWRGPLGSRGEACGAIPKPCGRTAGARWIEAEPRGPLYAAAVPCSHRGWRFCWCHGSLSAAYFGRERQRNSHKQHFKARGPSISSAEEFIDGRGTVASSWSFATCVRRLSER